MSQSELYEGRKVQLADQRTGIIRFSGHTQFAPGLWVGIELDDATGKNDGSVQDHRYFECPMGHGMFVRPNTLKLLAGPPAPFLPQPNKKPRPSSTISTGSTKGPAPLDPGLTRRISVNAPSPTPPTRTTRPTPRVSAFCDFVSFSTRFLPFRTRFQRAQTRSEKLTCYLSYRLDRPRSSWALYRRMPK